MVVLGSEGQFVKMISVKFVVLFKNRGVVDCVLVESRPSRSRKYHGEFKSAIVTIAVVPKYG